MSLQLPHEATRPAAGRLSADDRLDIQQLVAGEFSHALESGNFQAWADLFTENGSFLRGGKPPITGRRDLLEYARRRWERPEQGKRKSWVANVVIWPTAEGAAASSRQLIAERQAEGDYRIIIVSDKLDEFRHEGGRWRFHIRRTVGRSE